MDRRQLLKAGAGVAAGAAAATVLGGAVADVAEAAPKINPIGTIGIGFDAHVAHVGFLTASLL